MPPRSTELRLSHFDELAYKADSSTILYKFLDALCGDAGAGSLKKEIFLQRLSGSLDSIYGSDLDYIFGTIRFLSRTTSEAYPYNPMSEQLTSPQWDEVMTKDAAYRARIREYFTACAHGNTVDGIRQAVHAAISCDAQVMESWRWIDDFGISEPLGRASGSSYAAVDLTTGHRVLFSTEAEAVAFLVGKSHWQVQEVKSRAEVTVVPHKQTITPREAHLLTEMLRRISDVSTVITVDPNGLSVHSPIEIRAITADSTYYQVEKMVTGTVALNEIPAPEMLAIDLDPSALWLNSSSPELAPYAQFNITQETSYCYLVSGGKRSPIDEVSYGVLGENNQVRQEAALEWYEQSEQFGEWTPYERADSPDNFPGGKFGLTPSSLPAINPDRSPYQFAYTTQSDYVAARRAEVVALGGEANEMRYRLPMQRVSTSKRTYTPDLAIAYTAPVRESTVTSGWTSRKPHFFGVEQRNPSLFVRS